MLLAFFQTKQIAIHFPNTRAVTIFIFQNMFRDFFFSSFNGFISYHIETDNYAYILNVYVKFRVEKC